METRLSLLLDKWPTQIAREFEIAYTDIWMDHRKKIIHEIARILVKKDESETEDEIKIYFIENKLSNLNL